MIFYPVFHRADTVASNQKKTNGKRSFQKLRSFKTLASLLFPVSRTQKRLRGLTCNTSGKTTHVLNFKGAKSPAPRTPAPSVFGKKHGRAKKRRCAQ